MTPDQLDRLIARYVGGEASPEETAWLEARMAEDVSLAQQVDALRRSWEAAGTVRSPWDSSDAWKSVKARLVPPAADDSVPARPAVVPASGRLASERVATGRVAAGRPATAARRRRSGWLLGRVAAVLFLASGGWWAADRASRAEEPEPLHLIATERAQVGNVNLSDGTRVVLGVESELRFAPSFGGETRDVYLDGNAYFDVAKDPERPFRVHTAHGVTEVLGTSFGVRAYDADSMTTVVVAEGRVRVEQALDGDGERAPEETNAVVLEPGDLGRVTARGEIEKQRGVAVERHLAWKERRLVFTDAPLRDIVAELARWYDFDFTIGDASLERRRLSATFAHQSLEDMLDNLEIALGARVERDGRTITFQSQ